MIAITTSNSISLKPRSRLLGIETSLRLQRLMRNGPASVVRIPGCRNRVDRGTNKSGKLRQVGRSVRASGSIPKGGHEAAGETVRRGPRTRSSPRAVLLRGGRGGRGGRL